MVGRVIFAVGLVSYALFMLWKARRALRRARQQLQDFERQRARSATDQALQAINARLEGDVIDPEKWAERYRGPRH